jgi:hypothetical protein
VFVCVHLIGSFGLVGRGGGRCASALGGWLAGVSGIHQCRGEIGVRVRTDASTSQLQFEIRSDSVRIPFALRLNSIARRFATPFSRCVWSCENAPGLRQEQTFRTCVSGSAHRTPSAISAITAIAAIAAIACVSVSAYRTPFASTSPWLFEFHRPSLQVSAPFSATLPHPPLCILHLLSSLPPPYTSRAPELSARRVKG